MSRLIDLRGESFGKWLVVARAGGGYWLCQCECGAEREVFGGSLRGGRSNGCINCHNGRGPRRRHGAKRTRLYTIWSRMIGRCENRKDPAFPRYGGRGIAICQPWRGDFVVFQRWAFGHGYSDALTLERIDNDKGYEPGNCCWATYTEQNRNRRNNKPIIYRGETVLIPVLAERHGLPADIVKNRITRYGWPVDRAITEPVRKRKVHKLNVDQLERKAA